MKRSFLVLSVVLLFFGCAQKKLVPGEQVKYGMFFTPADHVAQLLETGKVDDALGVYDGQALFFNDEAGDEDVRRVVADLCGAARNKYQGPAEKAVTALDSLAWPAPVAQWPRTRLVLENANRQAATLLSMGIFRTPGCGLETVNTLTAALSKTKQRIKDSAPGEFLKYPLLTDKDFFKRYPMSISGREVVNKDWPELEKVAAQATANGVAHFFKTYKSCLNSDQEQVLAQRYFVCSLGGDPDQAGLKSILAAERKTRQAGFKAVKIDGLNVVMVQATSPSLIQEKYLEFPIGIEVDLPFKAEKKPLDKVFSSKVMATADIVILVNVAVAKITRDVTDLEDVASKYVSGTKTVSNPRYEELAELKRQIVNQSQLHSSQSYNAFLAFGLIGAISHSMDQNKINDALAQVTRELANTPKTIDEPVISDYAFNTVDMDVAKEATVHYYIINTRKRTIFSSTFDARQEKSFTVAYKMKKSDTNKSKYLNQMDVEDDVERFEKRPISVDLSTLLGQYLEGNGKSGKFKDMAQVRDSVMDQRNKAIALFQSEKFEATPVNDDRFDSVVVVFHPGGGLGSGFFVRDDMVLTNFHVIKGVKYVEMKMFDGQETFGKVVATDPRLDLALVRVQARGKPVKFMKSRNLPLGSGVEAIGHPSGLEFSITRGVVSAMRKLDSSYAPGGKKILFVQTDTPINPGNSGGPLFLGDAVIGLNNQKLAATQLEGLGFAIHYSEAEKFLRKHGISYLEE